MRASIIKYSFLLLAAAALQTAAVAPTFAQAAAPRQSALLAPWVVSIDGETRLRTLRFTRMSENAKDVFSLEGKYGIIEGDQQAATAQMTQSGKERALKVTTPGQSVIIATQTADGVFSGIMKFRSGNEKPVRLERVSEQQLQAKVLAAIAAREGQEFADETKDWGVAPTRSQRPTDHHAPTPLSLQGAKVVKTIALRKLLATDRSVVVVDVLDGEGRTTVPGARWMPGAGLGLATPEEKSRFAQGLKKLTAGNMARPLVFVCLSAECWLSYNASLLAVEAGWRNVMWYRGGVEAWNAAGLATEPPKRFDW
jgi:PQQ-dependent catabolism-associated CXXCW motif protein